VSSDYDVIVVGAGPSGLMAALSASQGTPFWSARPARFGRVLVLEEHAKPGGIAAFGTLSITNGWIVKGGQLKVMLLDQLRDLPVEILAATAATGIRAEGGGLAVDTGAGTFRAPSVVVACGIFPHLPYLRFRNAYFLAETLAGQRAFVRRAERALAGGASPSRRVLVAGSHPSAEETAARFRALSGILEVESVVASRHDGTEARLADRLTDGRVSQDPALRKAAGGLAAARWNSGEAGVRTDYLAVVFDYNAYKLRPENAVRLAEGAGLALRDGYLVADAWGRTNVAGVWACGNAIFPLSGILQALYSGFVAGLSARSATALADFDRRNGFLPWLAVPNAAWAGWLESARELSVGRGGAESPFAATREFRPSPSDPNERRRK